MWQKKAFIVRKEEIKKDPALQAGSRGARKLLVTEVRTEKEQDVFDIEWLPNPSGKTPVQLMENSEVAFFTHHAAQDRHYHNKGTEVYIVLEGKMVMDVDGQDYNLTAGDLIVVHSEVVHRVKPQGTEFLACVITMNCGGARDKVLVETGKFLAEIIKKRAS